MVIKEKTIGVPMLYQVTDTRKRWISMWVNQDGAYCIGYIHKNGTRVVYRKGQKNYIERMWRNYR